MHKYIFGDIYGWAGQFRTIPMVKGERVLGGDTIRYSLPDDLEHDLIDAVSCLEAINWSELSIDETADVFAKKIAEFGRYTLSERVIHELL